MKRFPIESFRSGYQVYKDHPKVKVTDNVFVKLNPGHASIRLVFAGAEIPKPLYDILEDFGYIGKQEDRGGAVEPVKVVEPTVPETQEPVVGEEPAVVETPAEEVAEPKAKTKPKTTKKKN